MDQEAQALPLETGRDEEAVLLARIARKERQAFEVIYRLYCRRLTRFLDKLTRRPQLIDEILDDTMLAVWQGAAGFHGASRVSTWIFGIAYRQAMKAITRERKHAERGADGDDIPAGTDAGPEAELMRRESRDMLVHLLGGLSTEQRAVVELTYYYGYAYKEIALIVDCPVDTVKTRMFHARRKLRALLAAQGGH